MENDFVTQYEGRIAFVHVSCTSLFAGRIDLVLNDLWGFVFTPVIVVRVDASVVLQVYSFQIFMSNKVDVNARNLVVIDCNYFQDWIVLEEIAI